MKLTLRSRSVFMSIIGILIFSTISAQTTNVTVRAKAKDAKFIGTSIGGAKIIIKNARTGQILSEGITTGSTGNTEKIMKTPQQRHEPITEETTAKFIAQIELKTPVFVTVEAYAPVSKKQATVLTSTQLWLIPEKDIDGEGLILEVPGFVVDILSPQTHESTAAEDEILLKANVVMMCGCPTSPDGIWDANNYEVNALITNESGDTKEIPLKFSGKQSTFEASTKLPKGVHQVSIYAYDPQTGNTGLDQTSVIVN